MRLAAATAGLVLGIVAKASYVDDYIDSLYARDYDDSLYARDYDSSLHTRACEDSLLARDDEDLLYVRDYDDSLYTQDYDDLLYGRDLLDAILEPRVEKKRKKGKSSEIQRKPSQEFGAESGSRGPDFQKTGEEAKHKQLPEVSGGMPAVGSPTNIKDKIETGKATGKRRGTQIQEKKTNVGEDDWSRESANNYDKKKIQSNDETAQRMFSEMDRSSFFNPDKELPRRLRRRSVPAHGYYSY